MIADFDPSATWRVMVNDLLHHTHSKPISVFTPSCDIMHCTVIREDQAMEKVTYKENFTKFGHVVFDICEWTDRPTYRHGHWSNLYSSQRKSNNDHFIEAV